MRLGLLSLTLVVCVITSLAFMLPTPAQAVSADVVISQVYGGGGNSGTVYTNDFVELFNRGSVPVSLAGWSIQYTSATGTGNFGSSATLLTELPAVTLQPGQYYLVQEAQGSGGTTPLPSPDFVDPTPINMSGTGGKVALVTANVSLGCNGGSTPCDATKLALIKDLVGWGTANFFEGAAAAPATTNTTAVIRAGGGCSETDANGADFSVAAPTPRNTATAVNFCNADNAPVVSSTGPINGAVDVAVDASLTIDFSEAVNVSDGWYSIECASSGTHAAAVSGGPQGFVLDPDADFAAGESCTVTVYAASVSDQDVVDPPDGPVSDMSFTFTTLGPVCAQPFTPAYSIQGDGADAAVTGSVTTQGVVVGDYEGTTPNLRGFFLQDVTGDGNPATSDGIFVFNGNTDSVSLGQVVRVTGTAADFQGQTQISASAVTDCGESASVEPVDVTLPFASADFAERFEGMLVRLPQTLYVTEHFQLGRFGQVVLSSEARLKQPTNVTLPGAPALALQAANNLNRIILDDALNNQNPDPILFGRGGLPLSAENTLRGGDALTGVVGVMTYTWSGNSASGNAWRVRPVNALGGGIPDFAPANPRPESAPDVGGNVVVAGMNLLNFFNTFDGASSNPPYACNLGVGGDLTDCRGADDATEFERQWPKTVAAIIGTNADVIGVIEMENDGYGSDSAIQFLVDKLNDATAPGTYAFIDADAASGQLNALGTDAIKVGLLYKPARVTPVGTTAILNSVAFVNGGDSAARNRATLAQAFEQNGTGARFIITVNHFKSKGSACDAPDAGDGQGNCNAVRVNAANALTAWLAGDPTGTGDPDVLIVGDLNSYALEDPITAIRSNGYVNLIQSFLGDEAYSYAFDGQWGYLDHALGSASLAGQVTGVAEWHINADEPSVLDYNDDFKSAGQLDSLYSPDQFRISDHDPVIVGLDLNAPPTVEAGGPYTLVEGDSVTLTATAGDPDGDPLAFAWDLDDDGVFETAGQSVSFSAPNGPADLNVSVRVTDPGGLSASALTTVTVTNAAPVVGVITAPEDPARVNTTVDVSAAFTDPGMLDTHTAVWDWGDGTTSAGSVSETNGSGTVSGSHQYAAAGLYDITLTVTDMDGAAGQAVFPAIVVIDLRGGSVSGGGWIYSAPGAYLPNPARRGPAMLSFAVAYPRRHHDLPLGSLLFTFQGGSLRFRATSFDWLVVDKSDRTAQLQGSGRLNGRGGYRFMVWVESGHPGTFRIRIWWEDGAGEHVVYDNGVLQPLLGGMIVIHR
jgi:predicted extracellular nuclease